MNQTVIDLIERRSVKSYKPEQVKEEQLAEILEAGKYAASGMGKQPVKMVVIQDKETRNQLARLNNEVGIVDRGDDPFYGAPTVIAVLADKNSGTYREDGSLTIGNLMNAAHALGVDSCWIHRAKQQFETEKGKALLTKWGIDENYEGIGHCILGYRDGEYPKPKPRKDDLVIRI